jgi:hypothetical protein
MKDEQRARSAVPVGSRAHQLDGYLFVDRRRRPDRHLRSDHRLAAAACDAEPDRLRLLRRAADDRPDRPRLREAHPSGQPGWFRNVLQRSRHRLHRSRRHERSGKPGRLATLRTPLPMGGANNVGTQFGVSNNAGNSTYNYAGGVNRHLAGSRGFQLDPDLPADGVLASRRSP